ncbi:MAG: zinc ribbon domain-containing protein [Eubacteriales bacterium]
MIFNKKDIRNNYKKDSKKDSKKNHKKRLIKKSIRDSFFEKQIKHYTSKKYCPKCNEKIDVNARNCKYCGAFIAKTSKNYDSKKIIKSSRKDKNNNKNIDLKVCINCGEVNKNNAVYCYICKGKVFKSYNKYLKEIEEKDRKIKQKPKVFGKIVLITVTILYISTEIKIWFVEESINKGKLRLIFAFIILLDLIAYCIITEKQKLHYYEQDFDDFDYRNNYLDMESASYLMLIGSIIVGIWCFVNF